jgi:hypothetical protein
LLDRAALVSDQPNLFPPALCIYKKQTLVATARANLGPTRDYQPTGAPKGPKRKVPSLMQVRNYSDVLSAMSKAQLVITAVVLEGRSKCEVARDYDVSRQWVQQLCKRCLTRRGLHHPAVRWQSGRMRPESAPGPTRDDWATSGGSGVRRQVISSQVMSVR